MIYLLQAGNSMSLIPKVVTFFFIGIAVLGVVTYLQVNSEYRRNMKSPIIQHRAKLLSRRVEVKGHKNPAKDPRLNPTASSYHVLRFRLQDGSLKEYDVPEEAYHRYAEGQIGQLFTQGTWFKDFDPKIEITKGDDIASQTKENPRDS